tara:strand:+ start:228 stop:467 length:240 start_codon:yes stop_codon:yes gene_type:complete
MTSEIFYVKKYPGNAYRFIDKPASLLGSTNSDDTFSFPTLHTAPLFKDGSIDHEQWGEVEMPEPIFKEVQLGNFSRNKY